MIKKSGKLRTDIVENLMDGEGSVNITHLLEIEDFHNNGRLYAKLLLKPGRSIGYHVHNGEQESYYILKGEGLYNDNGKEVVVKKGDFTLCKNGEGHSIKNIGEEDLELIGLITNI